MLLLQVDRSYEGCIQCSVIVRNKIVINKNKIVIFKEFEKEVMYETFI